MKVLPEGTGSRAEALLEATKRPEIERVIRARAELLGGRADVTAPKVKAVERAFAAGFGVEAILRALAAIRDARADGGDGRSLAAFCATRNRSFEYALRPDTLQRILDEAEAAPSEAVPDTAPPDEPVVLILGPRKLA